MLLIKDEMLRIVNSTKVTPAEDITADLVKFKARKDWALAIIVSSIEPKLLYIIGNSTDPAVV